jgi:hypothetical protein
MLDAPNVPRLTPAAKARIATARAKCRDPKHGGRCYNCGTHVDRWNLTELDLDRAYRLPESVNFRANQYGNPQKDGLDCQWCAGPNDD